MKQIICILLFLLLLACERGDEFEYSFIIAKCSYADGSFMDSTTYYYDSENRLLRIDECLTTSDCKEYRVVYEPKVIKIINGRFGSFYINDEDKVNKWVSNNMQVDYQYENELITFESQYIFGRKEAEHFYKYNGLNVTQDSGIIYNQDGQIHTTVYNYSYTDTIAPHFLIGFPGLFEYPLKHQYLIREVESIENGILYKYTYEISENELIEYSEMYDTFHGIREAIWTTRYYYIE